MMSKVGIKIGTIAGILVIPLLLLLIVTVGAAPVLPAEYYGQVYINGSPAPAGTVITATINNVVVSSILTTEVGLYGGPGTFDPRLIVEGSENGQPIIFLINGKQADKTTTFSPGKTEHLSLSTGISLQGTSIASPESPQVTQTNPSTNPTQTPNPIPSTTTIAVSSPTTVTPTIQQSIPVVTDTVTSSLTHAVTQKISQSTPIQPVATKPQSEKTSTPGFSFQTVGLLVIVGIVTGVIIRK
jgi:hypothetical protein